jgi:hypothetical protein
VQINFGHMAYADARASMQLFASEVMPAFRSAPAEPLRKVKAG